MYRFSEELPRLTDRQREILLYIEDFVANYGYPPSIRQIGDKFSIASTNGVRENLIRLEKKGYIIRTGSQSRGIKLCHVENEPTSGKYNSYEDSKSRSIPLLGSVAAGLLQLEEELHEFDIVLDKSLVHHSGDVFALKIKGESMRDSDIKDGDIVFVQPNVDVKVNDVVIAMWKGEATIKRLFKEPGFILLMPSNPEFEPIKIPVNDPEFVVVGRVVGQFRGF